jgi:hypothetical protein
MNRSQVLKLTVAMVTLPARVVTNSFSFVRVTKAPKRSPKPKRDLASVRENRLSIARVG